MYINMNAFLGEHNYTVANKDKLIDIIQLEVETRIDEANKVYNQLAQTKLSDKQIKKMFQMLTVDKVSKQNVEKYNLAEQEYEKYLSIYKSNDNQNYQKSLFGFVNAYTNINTRSKQSPLDVLKPVLPANVINNPCNFEYLCRAAVIHNNVAA